MTDPRLQELIAAIEQADSPGRLIAAVRALASARLDAAIPTLIQALGYNNPGAAVVAVDGLVQLGEVAVQPLLEQLDGYNYGARAYAIRALAAIADPRALEVLLDAAAADFAPSVRRAATKGLGYLHWHKLSAEEAAIAQARALKTLRLISTDPDWAIRYAAVVGLQALAQSIVNGADSERCQQDEIVRLVLERLEEMVDTDADASTQARACLAQQRLNAVDRQPLTAGR